MFQNFYNNTIGSLSANHLKKPFLWQVKTILFIVIPHISEEMLIIMTVGMSNQNLLFINC